MEFKYKQAYEMIKTGTLVWKTKNMKSYRSSCVFCFGSKMLKLNDELTCLTACTKFKSKFCWDYLQEGGWKKCITEVHPFLIHWWVVYAILLLCWSTACFITMLSFTQLFHIVELYVMLIHCWSIPYFNTLLSKSQILLHCWAIPNPNTLLRYTLF